MPSRRARVLELTLLVVGLCVPVGLLDGPAYLAGVAVLMVATAVGCGAFAPDRTARGDRSAGGDRAARGLPLAPQVVPVVAAFGAAGLVHLAGADPTWLLALLVGGGLVAATLVAEQRLTAPADERQAHLERQLLPLVLVVAFVAFVAAAGGLDAVLGAPSEDVVDGPAGATLTASGLLLLAVVDAALAAALGYRLAALRLTSLAEALRVAGTYAVVAGVAAALLRAIDLPRLFGPAVLVGVFYLWTAYREASAPQRRTSAWLWEYGLLAVVLLLVVGWNLLLR